MAHRNCFHHSFKEGKIKCLVYEGLKRGSVVSSLPICVITMMCVCAQMISHSALEESTDNLKKQAKLGRILPAYNF